MAVLESLYPLVPQRYKNAAKHGAAFVNRLSSSQRMKPNFLIIGAQKAGTSSLFKYLMRHGHFLRPLLKDVYFFDRNYRKGMEWYLSFYPSVAAQKQREGQLGGPVVSSEGATHYILNPWVPERVRQTFPDIKIIVLLRNPVQRAISHYFHNRRMGSESLTSALEAFQKEQERIEAEEKRLFSDPDYSSHDYDSYTYLTRGRYAEQLERWFEHFPREQFLILCSEQFYKDTDRHFRAVCKFIGIPEKSLDIYRAEGKGTNRQEQPDAMEMARDYFRPHNEKLFELLGERYDWPSLKDA